MTSTLLASTAGDAAVARIADSDRLRPPLERVLF
jgi:hypothetical protein